MEQVEEDDDFLIEKFDFEADMVDRFVLAGIDKGEACLMFSLLNEPKPDIFQLARLKLLKNKFLENKNKDVQNFLGYVEV